MNRPLTLSIVSYLGTFMHETWQEEYRRPVSIVKGAEWLAELAA